MNTWARSAAIGVALILGAVAYLLIGQPPEAETTTFRNTATTTTRATAQAPTTRHATRPSPTTSVVDSFVPDTTTPDVQLEPPAVFAQSLDWLEGHELATELEISAAVWVEGIGTAWSYNPHLQLFPASNQKLFTAAAALHLLAADHAFSTTLFVADKTAPNTGEGNLYLRAGGDPTLTRDGLAKLAKSAAASGLGRVDGDLVVDVSRFSTDRMAPGWQDWQMPTYVGPLSTLILDSNRWTEDEEFLNNPDIANAEVFHGALSAAGVDVTGVVRLGIVPSDATEIARLQSVPVSRLVSRMMGESNNVIAEALLREIGAEHGGRGSTEAGSDTAHQSLRNAGIDLAGNTGDGSGLSRANLHSSKDWVSFLRAASDSRWFNEFRDSLPVAGVNGTLANRLTAKATKGNVRAKTGTIIGGRALSGYLTLASGEAAAFSIVVNGERSHEALGLIDRWVTAIAETVLPGSGQ